jgi:hypothetical protein
MKTIVKSAAVAAVAGALALSAITPSEAQRRGRGWVAPAAGFVAGAAIGAAAANANAAYYDGYYYYGEPGYVYDPGPTYVAPYDGYSYEPRYRYRNSIDRRHLDGTE